MDGIMDVKRMQEIQRELQAKYEWTVLEPESGKQCLLWGIGEIGEVIDIMKKEGNEYIMNHEGVRKDFITEMVDVYMYLAEVLLCYGITPEEFTKVYEEKHATNMHRWDD